MRLGETNNIMFQLSPGVFYFIVWVLQMQYDFLIVSEKVQMSNTCPRILHSQKKLLFIVWSLVMRLVLPIT